MGPAGAGPAAIPYATYAAGAPRPAAAGAAGLAATPAQSEPLRERAGSRSAPATTRACPTALARLDATRPAGAAQAGNSKTSGSRPRSSLRRDQREVIRAMKNTHPIGIPYSLILENLFAKTYDMDNLEEDKDRVRRAHRDKGYFTAKVLDRAVNIHQSGGQGFRLPLIKPNNAGIVADIKLPVEEGRLYYLHSVNFVAVKLFRMPETLMQPLFKMSPGNIFSTAKLRDGLKNMRDLYGQFGYIDFVPEPSFDIPPNSDQVDLTLTADEGKQFFVRRLDFTGNTTTCDRRRNWITLGSPDHQTMPAVDDKRTSEPHERRHPEARGLQTMSYSSGSPLFFRRNVTRTAGHHVWCRARGANREAECQSRHRSSIRSSP